jgi:hypothetical protein
VTLRFQLDEHISHAVAQQLAMRGIDVVTAEMSGLLNTPDPIILEHARVNRRVVVTFDADYAALHSRGVSHAGIAYFPKAPNDAGVLVETLLLLDAVFDHDYFENWLEYL